jgi:hypothetical protein
MMSNVILTVDGAEKIKEEILHIETIKLPELKAGIKKARNEGEDTQELAEQWDFYCNRVPSLKNMLSTAKIVGRVEPIKVGLKKKGAHTLERAENGTWTLDDKEIEQERAIQELAEAVTDLGYWRQVAKDVLPAEEFAEVQRCVEYQG